ncbi:MAG TPA: DUF502 domain-containing protein [Niabella sp.]|nr:DUF502 domain-containing protein [Niabella sp.]HOZ97914.1 DUF502 domain-containing protein [Niabella sp.]HQW15940.1 DUF502 domain-containing protein [Niabella sp.]HQX21112.1 DUF502 domain-containing protein [Niabella sp.]HQX40560.1 DUF502 domain-containing protein [Niabella sp.]
MKGSSILRSKDTILKTLFRYFVQGVIVLAPVSITAYILYVVFSWIDSLLRPAVFTTPGIGFLLIVGFIIFTGWISSYFIMESVINFFDHWLERTPGIKLIYKSIKDFFQAFTGDKKKFKKAVLANVFNNDVWIVGFLTDDEMEKFDMGEEMVAVYVPQAYNFAGQLYILPKDRVKPIEHITPGDAMKYTVTGGVVES